MDEIPVLSGRAGADERGIEGNRKVNDLKRDIETNRYDVPAPAVADAMLRKIRLLKRAREGSPVSEAGRTPPGSEGPRGR